MSEPKFYKANILTSEAQLTGSYVVGSNSLSLLYDSDSSKQWITSGANADSQFVDMRISVSAGTYTSIIILKNHNLRADGYSLSHWNGSEWETFTNETRTVVTDNSGKVHTVITFDRELLHTNGILLYMLNTAVSHQEKAIGELIISDLLFDAPDFSTYDPKWRERSKEIVLGDGSLHKVYTKDKSGRLSKYEAALKFHYLSKATRDALKAIKDTGEPFLFQPESVTVPEDIYYVHWSNTWDEKYMSNFKSAGYEVVMNLKEV